MSFYGMCNLNNLIANIADIVTQYDSALSETIQNYDGAVAQVEESLEESREYWNKFASDERRSAGEQAGTTIEGIESVLTRMKAILNELARLDKAFEKYYTKHEKDSCLIPDDLNESTDYLSLVKRLGDRLRNEANECSRTIKSFPFQSLEMTFSGKRKKRYADLIGYYSQAEQIANIASDVLPRKTSEYWEAVAAGRDEEIQKAENESAELIAAIRAEKQSEVAKLLSAFQEEIDSLLPADYLLQLNDYMSSGKVENRSGTSSFNSLFPIGYYAHDFQGAINNGAIIDILVEKLECIMSDTTVVVPAIFDATGGNNFGIRTNSLGYESMAKKFVLSIVFSSLANTPAGHQRFVLMDPEDRTNGFRSIIDFVSTTPEIMGDRILTTKDQMQKALADLSAHIDSAAQKQFVGYENIFEYNQSVKDKPEPYRTLVIMDFPKYFDEQMLDSLWNIVNNGNPFGVGVVLQFNDSFKEARASDRYYSLFQKIENKMIPFEETSGMWLGKNNVTLLPCDFDEQEFFQFSQSFKENYEQKKREGISLDKIIDIANIGTGSSAEYLSIPFAIDEAGGIKSLEFGDPIASGLSHYALVTGSTGSGKSTLLHTIVMSAITKYSPDELNIYLMDFKEGTEFKIYAEKQVPHIKLLSMDTMQEFGQSILSELCVEMTRRADLFKEASQATGRDIKNITQYREVTGHKLPRILSILDEFQMLFDADANRRVANSCGKMVANLISLARVYGIHFIFATQTLSRIYTDSYSIRKATLNEMHVRVGLKGTEAEADLLFGSTNGKIAFSKYGESKGLGAYVDDDTTGIPTGFKCAYCPDDLQSYLLEQLAALYADEPASTRVFSGSYIPQLESSSEYIALDINDPFLLLGEPIMIGADLKVVFSAKKRTNLLVLGSNGDTTTRLTDLSILSFKRNFSTDSTLYYLDGERISGGDIPASTGRILADTSNIQIIDSESTTIDALDKVYDWYIEQKRIGSRSGRKRIFILIKHLQWIDSINRMLLGKSVDEYKSLGSTLTDSAETDLFDFIPKEKNPNDLSDLFDDFNSDVTSQNQPAKGRPNYRAILMELIEFGYMYGVNIVLTASDFTSIKEYMYDIVPKFSERIIFGLSDIDADRIVPEAKVQNLPDNILLYTNGVNMTFQFKPFSYSGLNEV